MTFIDTHVLLYAVCAGADDRAKAETARAAPLGIWAVKVFCSSRFAVPPRMIAADPELRDDVR